MSELDKKLSCLCIEIINSYHLLIGFTDTSLSSCTSQTEVVIPIGINHIQTFGRSYVDLLHGNDL